MTIEMQPSRPTRVQRAMTWLAWAGGVTLAMMALLTFADVIGREVFRSPIPPKVELTELLMALTVYLGLGLTTITRGQIRVDVIVLYLPVRLRAVLDTITYAISFLFVCAIGWRLLDRMLIKLEKSDETQLLAIPTWPFAAVMFACTGAMAVALSIIWYDSLKSAVHGGLSEEGGTPAAG